MNFNIEEVEQLCKPLVDYLKNHNPYTSIVVTTDFIKVEQTQVGIPIKSNKDVKQINKDITINISVDGDHFIDIEKIQEQIKLAINEMPTVKRTELKPQGFC